MFTDNSNGGIVLLLSAVAYVIFNDVIRQTLADVGTEGRLVLLLFVATMLFAFTRNSGGKR